jgi:hypothetical protein
MGEVMIHAVSNASNNAIDTAANTHPANEKETPCGRLDETRKLSIQISGGITQD